MREEQLTYTVEGAARAIGIGRCGPLEEMTEQMKTAYHEAGHALAYTWCGLSFRYVTIRPTSRQIHGCVRLSRPRMTNTFRLAVIRAAGASAQGYAAWLRDTDDECELYDHVLGAVLFDGGEDDCRSYVDAA